MDIDTTRHNELARRRQLAVACRRRESERGELLARYVRMKASADELQSWIKAYGRLDAAGAYPELQRMAAWAEAQLKELSVVLSPERLCATLRDRDLFPETDHLHDPEGDPPRHQPWGDQPWGGNLVSDEWPPRHNGA